MSCNDSAAKQVKLNLVHYNLWTSVHLHEICGINDEKISILSGLPPSKLDVTDSDDRREWVIPQLASQKKSLNIKEIENWFQKIAQKLNNENRPKRITIGLMNDDSTVVYYFIHDGIVKPRQN